MRLKPKLAYFALGCAFTVLGQVGVTLVAPKATAADNKDATQTLTCRQLKAVDDEGNVVITLVGAEDGGFLAFYDKSGKPRLTAGMIPGFDGASVAVSGTDGRPRVQAGEFNGNGVVRTLNERVVTGSLPGASR